MRPNPLLALPFEPQLEGLGADYWDVVEAAQFPRTQLRFRNDSLLHQIGLNPASVSDAGIEAAYGRFEARTPLLALPTTAISSAPKTPFWAMAVAFSMASCATAMSSCRTWAPKAAALPPGAAATSPLPRAAP